MKVFSVVLKFVGKISKGHNSVKMLMELHFFSLCTLSDDGLYLYKVS